MSISKSWGFCSMGLLIVSKVLTTPTDDTKDFMDISVEEFCSGKKTLRVNPKHIPELIDRLNTCFTTSLGNPPVKEILANLFDSATPIVHKAFFDRKTGLKEVSSFTRIKNEFAKMKDTVCNTVSQFLKEKHQDGNLIVYAPEDDGGSYIIDEDIRLCSEILNRNTDIHNVLRQAQLPKVDDATQTINFPPLNITLSTASDDVPYLILDTYVLCTRCLSFTNMNSETSTMVARHLIRKFKKEIMPYVAPGDFEKAYSNIISVTSRHPVESSPDIDDCQGVCATPFQKMPMHFQLDLEIPDVDSGESPAGEESSIDDPQLTSTLKTESSSRKPQKEAMSGEPPVTIGGWTLKEPYELINGQLKPIQVIHEKGSIVKDFESFAIACHDKFTTVSFMVTAAVLGCLFTLALVILCLIRGHCGYITLWPKGEEDYDAEASNNIPDPKGKKGPAFRQLPFNSRDDSKTMNDIEIELKRVSPDSRQSKGRETFTENDRQSFTAYNIPLSSFDMEEENQTSNLESMMYPDASKTGWSRSEESMVSSVRTAERPTIPNHECQLGRSKGKGNSGPSYCDCSDSNQAEVLATLHRRCEVLSKRICHIVRQISNDSVIEVSPSIESLKKFVRSVSREVVHDSDTISHLRSTPFDPLISELEWMAE